MESPSPTTTPAPLGHKSAFIIGVTGNLDPVEPSQNANLPSIAETIASVLDWVRSDKGWLDPQTRRFHPAKQAPNSSPSEYRHCWNALGLRDTPIVLLSSLAPGIDTIVARAALDYAANHPGAEIHVCAPLPFPENIYHRCSSFKAEGDEAKKADLRDILTKVKATRMPGCLANNVFPVPLDPQFDGDPESDLEAETKITDSAGKPRSLARRHLRYRAAGEYVAAYCDLLLAIFDDTHDTAQPEDIYQSGTATIVEIKRRGTFDHLLPIPETLSTPDTGPVLVIPINRVKNKPTDLSKCPLLLLQPYDLRHSEKLEERRWQEIGDRVLREIIANLDHLNRDIAASLAPLGETASQKEKTKSTKRSEGRDKALFVMLGKEEAAKKVADQCSTFSFDRLARFRRNVADINADFDKDAKSHTSRLFTIGLCGLVMLALAGFPFEKTPMGTAGTTVKTVCFSLFLVSLLTGWAFHAVFKHRQTERKQLDYRGIAEGLRVQFFWSVAGTAASVASRYLQRLRGELSWIRCAISSVCFPYQAAQQWFSGLGLNDKISLLEGVQAGWIQEQANYFSRKVKDFTHARNSLHCAAGSMLWTAVWLGIGSAFQPAGFQVGGWGLWALLGLLLVLGMISLWHRRCTARKLHADAKSPKPKFTAYLASEEQWSGTKGHWWLWVFPGILHAFAFRTQRRSNLFSNALRWVLAFLVGSTLAFGLLGLVSLLDFPKGEPTALPGLFKNLAAGLSGFTFLWAARKFYSENIRRYEATHILFSGARSRMERYLTQLKSTPASDVASVKQTLQHVHDLLIALGEEALAENADWIISHRLRMIEPISPGT